MKIPPGTLFSIKDWESIFEIASSRKIKKLGWVAIPNSHDSIAYCRMMSRKDGAEIFAAWILLLQLSSRCDRRGILASSDGRPYCPEEMAVKTRSPIKIFTHALPYLCEMGWVEAEPSLGKSAGVVGESAGVSAGSGKTVGAHNITLHNKTLQTPNPLKGVSFPKNLNSKKFICSWGEWMAHRAEIRKPLKPTQIVKQLKRLSELGEAAAIEALEHTMENGWQGIRRPDEKDPNNKPEEVGNNTPKYRLSEIEKEMQKL